MNDGPSCWTCVHQQTSATNLLGNCLWFVKNRNEGAKPIPPAVVDKGCDYYEAKVSHPRVPHYHTCRDCPQGHHQYECRNARCVWSILVACPAAQSQAKHQKQETTK